MEKNLLLIYPSQLFTPDWGDIACTNPSLVNLLSYLKQFHDIDPKVLDLDIEIGRPHNKKEISRFKNKASEIIRKYKFDVVGISCSYSINYLSSIMVAQICRDINSNCIIVVGGMHASAVPDDFIYDGSPFDFIVIGEGEKALLNICRGKINRTKEPKKIMGELIDLNEIPTPNFKEYRYLYSQPTSTILYAISRGCPFRCSFCIESAKNNSNYRCLPVKRAIREIQEIADCSNIKKIEFVDPCFGLKKKWRRSFLQALVKIKIKCIFEFETRFDLLDTEDVDLLSNLNIQYLYLGLEHASPKMLFLMHKTKNPQVYLQKAEKIIKYLNERDVPNKILLIFNHPGETKSSIQESVRFLDSAFSGLKNISSVLTPKNYYFTPGTTTYYNLKRYEREFGTKVKYKTWWKKPYFDQHDFATDILPSLDLHGENTRELWKKDIYNIQHLCDSHRSKNFLAFKIGSKILLDHKRLNLKY